MIPARDVDRDRALTFLLSALLIGWVLLDLATTEGELSGLGLRGLARLAGLVIGGPVLIHLLLVGERNKLVLALMGALMLASCTSWSLRPTGDLARWILLGLLALLGLAFLARRPALMARLPLVAIGCVVVAALVSAFYAIREPLFAFEKAVSLGLLFAATLLYGQGCVEDPEDLRGFTESLGRVAAAFTVVNLAQIGSARAYSAFRFRGFTENPNTLGGFYTFLLVPLLHLFLESRFDRTPAGVVRSRVLGVSLGLAAGLLVYSGSRAGMLGSAVGLAVYMFLAQRPLFVRFLLLATPVLAGLLLLAPEDRLDEGDFSQWQAVARPQTLADHLVSTTSSGRAEAWGLAWDLVERSPWLGHGFGVTRFLFAEYSVQHGFVQHTGLHAHNSYLELALELGLPAAGLFTLAFLLVGLGGFRLARQDLPPSQQRMLAALVGALAGGLTGAVWESWLISAGSFGAFPIWLLAGLVLGATGLPRSRWQA